MVNDTRVFAVIKKNCPGFQNLVMFPIREDSYFHFPHSGDFDELKTIRKLGSQHENPLKIPFIGKRHFSFWAGTVFTRKYYWKCPDDFNADSDDEFDSDDSDLDDEEFPYEDSDIDGTD